MTHRARVKVLAAIGDGYATAMRIARCTSLPLGTVIRALRTLVAERRIEAHAEWRFRLPKES